MLVKAPKGWNKAGSTHQSSVALSGHSKNLISNPLGDAQCEVFLPLWGRPMERAMTTMPKLA